jgi:hypothetical protein
MIRVPKLCNTIPAAARWFVNVNYYSTGAESARGIFAELAELSRHVWSIIVSGYGGVA